MTVQYSETLRNNQLDQVESTTGASAKLYLRTGAQPANCAAADTGSLVATMDLDSDWMAAASGGTKGLAGTWQDTNATGNASPVAHFRIKDNAGTTCHVQGSVTATGGGGDIELDNTTINAGQTVTITSFTITAGNE